MDRLPEPPDGFEPGVMFDDDTLPLHVRRDEAERLMRVALKLSKERGLEWAQADAAYYSAKNGETLALQEEGVPVTAIALRIKGMKETNGALLRRNEAQVMYDNAKEAVNCFKLIVRVLEADIEREWNDAKRM